MDEWKCSPRKTVAAVLQKGPSQDPLSREITPLNLPLRNRGRAIRRQPGDPTSECIARFGGGAADTKMARAARSCASCSRYQRTISWATYVSLFENPPFSAFWRAAVP
jgi:hypothetical protein